MNYHIKQIEPKYYKKVHDFQCEYLDQESYEDFIKRIDANPQIYFIALVEDDLAGICYGHPSEKKDKENAINLQGIAVSLDESKDYARKGIGSKLIYTMEEKAKEMGYCSLDVGSADDPKVEAFYLKNSFKAYELVTRDEHDKEVRVSVEDYESGNIIRQQLREKYNPREVIFIFGKKLI